MKEPDALREAARIASEIMKRNSEETLAQLEQRVAEIARLIGPVFDSMGIGFALVGFTFGEKGWSTYVTNADRDDMIKAFEELVSVVREGRDRAPVVKGGGAPS